MSDSDVVIKRTKSPVEVVGEFVGSSVGAKVIMAVTGLGLWGFVIAHMLGNLQVFQGPEPLNAYGHFLQHELLHGAGVWAMRAGLLTITALHIAFGLRLAAKNRAARPVQYAKKKTMRTNPASLSMAVTGLVVLGFIVFHILHYTVGVVVPVDYALEDAKGRHDVFEMVWRGFHTPWIVAIYVIGQVVVLSHLTHGTVSLWQSLGWHHPVWTPVLRVVGRGLAVLIFAGNLGIVFAVWSWTR